MGPPANTCTVFRSNDLKIGGALSKVRLGGSVRYEKCPEKSGGQHT